MVKNRAPFLDRIARCGRGGLAFILNSLAVFPIGGVVLSLSVYIILYSILAKFEVFSNQPNYVIFGVPLLFVAPYLIAYIVDISNIKSHAFNITLGVIATFFGASLAFVQADIQGAQADREVFSRMLQRVMYQMAAANEGGEYTKIEKTGDKFYYTEAYFSALRDVLSSEKTSKFLSLKRNYELDLAYRALVTYMDTAANGTRSVAERSAAAGSFFGVVAGTYAYACALNEWVNGRFDYDENIKFGPKPHFIAFQRPRQPLLSVLPEVCRIIPLMSDVYK